MSHHDLRTPCAASWPPRAVAFVSVGAVLLGAWSMAWALSPSTGLSGVDLLWRVASATWLFVSGAAMLRGDHWARVAYCVWVAATLSVGLVVMHLHCGLGGYLLLASLYFVSNRRASAYFGRPMWSQALATGANSQWAS